MLRYCEIINEETGLVQLGVGCPDEYYIEIGMKKRQVKQSDINYEWYLSDKCPMKTKEQKEKEEKQARIDEIKKQLREVDEKSIRALRDGDTDYIEKYKQEAQELRDKLHELGA